MLRLPRLTHLILCALLSAGLAAGCDKNNKPDDEPKGAETSDVEETADEGDGSAEQGEREFPQLAKIELPDGFEIEMFAPNVPNARSLELTDQGTLFVSNRTGDKVFALKDTDGDGRADERHTITSGRRMPNGVAFRNGDLYVAEVSRVLKFPDIEENLDDPPEPEVIRDDFPTDRHHGWKFMKFGPDGKLYVPVGAPCNICEVDYDKYGNIQRMDPDGSNLEVWAKGVRNTVGFDWHPETGELWFTDNGGDNLGDNRPPDELNHAPTQGMHFGYPYCHGGDLPDPKLGDKRDCSEFEPPAQKLGPHVAALGMEFYEGEMFPEKYHNQIFIAEHGSWNRTNKIGYRVMLVTLDDNGEATSYEPFAEGWLQGEQNWGRPVDVEVMADGSLLVSDDQSGSVYRIVHRP
jgi:putative membrane-bound dehydrogenase-like protein